MATHQGKALARPELLGNQPALFDELQRYLRLEHPELKNIKVTWATPTEKWHKGLHMKWFNVTFTADD